MREILFRGKVERENEWVFGFYTESNPELDKGSVIENDDEYGCVVPETVGQYTGLKDKNGTKIFEGDIVYNEIEKCSCPVVFEKGSFWLFDKMLLSNNHLDFLGSYNFEVLEVIGNIYDNPELVENCDEQV